MICGNDMNINEIKVGKRYRKKLGDLSLLIESINDIGLLHPIIIDEDKRLICGNRRLESLRKIGLKELEENTHYRIFNIQDLIKSELHENAIRKDFLPTEMVAIYDAMESYELTGRKLPQSESDQGQRRVRATKLLDISTDTLSKMKQVVNSGDTELIEEMDRKDSVNAVYQKLKQKEDEARILSQADSMKLLGRYKTIVIDSPWKTISNVAGRAGGVELYKQMSVDEIDEYYKKEVESHVDDNAHIYLWVINNRIQDGFDLLKRWGFEYKTTLTWCKPTIGLGDYFRNNTEHILFGVKGKLKLRVSDIGTWFEAPKGKHSEKPDKSYEIIERASYPPYADVFPGKKRKNWDAVGIYRGEK